MGIDLNSKPEKPVFIRIRKKEEEGLEGWNLEVVVGVRKEVMTQSMAENSEVSSRNGHCLIYERNLNNNYYLKWQRKQ